MRLPLLVLAGSLLAACFLLEPAARSDDADPLSRIKAVAPPGEARRLDVKDFPVKQWVLGTVRQRDLKPIKARILFEIGPVYYVEEEGTGNWLVGRMPDPSSKLIEVESRFASLQALLDAHVFAPLPKPPEAFTLREVARLADFPTRLASDGRGEVLYALCEHGDVYKVHVTTGAVGPLLRARDYIDLARGEVNMVGMVLDERNRLYLVLNQRNEKLKPFMNEVVIFRTTAVKDGDPAEPKPWLKTNYPWGIGAFNHGVSHIAFGPDGYLYVNSGSRTDGNEPGDDPRYSEAGETPITACIWRLDPRADKPEVEVYAHGLRNAYGFCWNDKGEMIATENGPNADPPEELNLIEKGKHYGFPYKFSDWTKKPYCYTPDPPPGLTFVAPIPNHGPAGGGASDKPLYSFDPHSSPSGIVFLRDDFPPPYRGTYLMGRFGNFVGPRNTGFDVLQVALHKKDGAYVANTYPLLAPLGRPIDVHLSGKGKVFICEYSRETENKSYSKVVPGRILELAVKK
jgi:glucose/arabinose dehydrogenase